MRRSLLEVLWYHVQRGERRIIRVMVLASVILVLMQLTAVRDPVAFYLTMAERVEAPPLDLPPLADSTVADPLKIWEITLRATPAAPIRVLQNGKVLVTLTKGDQTLKVQPGQIQLDGTAVTQSVRVQVVKRDNHLQEPRLNQVFQCQGNVQNINIVEKP